MPKSDLFPFQSQNRHASAAEANKWTPSSDFLRDVKDIAEAVVEHKIRSIPDPWGRPLSFATAVFEPDYPQHATAQNQWRSLLARLAFAETREPWEVQQIVVDGNRGILGVLSLLRPKASYVYQSAVVAGSTTPALVDWSTAYLICTRRKDGEYQPAALFNPQTFISPCADEHFVDDKSWEKYLNEDKKRRDLVNLLRAIKRTYVQNPSPLFHALTTYIEDLRGETVPEETLSFVQVAGAPASVIYLAPPPPAPPKTRLVSPGASAENRLPLPTMAIWPAVKNSRWKKYFLCLHHDETPYTASVPDPSRGDELAIALGKTPDKLFHRSYPVAPRLIKTNVLVDGNPRIYQPTYNHGDHVNRDMPANPALKWVVTMDFGTSNTAVYCEAFDGPNSLGKRKAKLDGSLALKLHSPKENDIATLQQHFFPLEVVSDEQRSCSFPTLLYTEGAKAPKPMEGANVFYLSNLFPDFRPEKVKGNLKWDQDPATNARVQAFIAQVILQVAADAAWHQVAEIEVRFSHPGAFATSEGKMEDWRQVLHAAVKDAAEASNLTIVEGAPRTEAIATGLYFMHYEETEAGKRKTPLNAGAITIDLGGGTTDFALWEANRTLQALLAKQCSALFAGHQIFSRTLLQHRRYLEELVDAELKDATADPMDSMRLEKFREIAGKPGVAPVEKLSMIDTYLGTLGGRLLKRHERQLTTQEPLATAFAAMVAFKLGAVFYYAGLLARSGDYPVAWLCLGGNAVRTMDWLGTIPATNETFLIDLFLAGATHLKGKRPQIVTTKHHKSEVVLGLLHDYQASTRDNAEFMPAGEAFVSVDDNQPETCHDVMTDISSGLRTMNLGLGQYARLPSFRAYCAAFEKAKEATIFRKSAPPPLGPDDSDLIDQVSIELKETKEDPRRPIVPFFFVVVSTYCENWTIANAAAKP